MESTRPLLHLLALHVLSRAVVTAFSKSCPFHFEMDRIGFSGSLYCTKEDVAPMPGTAITIQLNGAEYMDLLKQAEDVNLSLPAFVLVRCGIQTWRLEAARGRPAAQPRGRPVRLALERRSVTIRVTEPEREQLAGEASQAGMLLTQHIRKRCGLQVRTTSLPGTDERENEADDAWERLKSLGPRDYFES